MFFAGVRELGAAGYRGPASGGLAGSGVPGRNRYPDALNPADRNDRISYHQTPDNDVCDLFTGVLYGAFSLGDDHCGKIHQCILRHAGGNRT